jgi:hypothetical protein
MLLLEILGETLDVLLPGAGFFVVTVTVRVRILGGLDEPNMVNEWYAVGCACAVEAQRMCTRSVSEAGCKSRGREEGYRLGGQLRVCGRS